MNLRKLIQEAASDNIFISQFDANKTVKKESFQLLLNKHIDARFGMLNLRKRFEDPEEVQAYCDNLYNTNEYKYELLARTADLTLLDEYFRTNNIEETETSSGSTDLTDVKTGTDASTFIKGAETDTKEHSFIKGAQQDSNQINATKGEQTDTNISSITKGEEEDETQRSLTVGTSTTSGSSTMDTGAGQVTTTLGTTKTTVKNPQWSDSVTESGNRTSEKEIAGYNSGTYVNSEKTTDTANNYTTTTQHGLHDIITTGDQATNTVNTAAKTDASQFSNTDSGRADAETTTVTLGERTDSENSTITSGERTDASTETRSEGARTDTASDTLVEGTRTDTTSSTSNITNTKTGSSSGEKSRTIQGFNTLYATLVQNARNAALFNLVDEVARDVISLLTIRIYDFEAEEGEET